MDRVSLWGRGMPPRTAGGLAPTPVLLRLLARHRADPRRWVEGVSKGPWVTAQRVLSHRQQLGGRRHQVGRRGRQARASGASCRAGLSWSHKKPLADCELGNEELVLRRSWWLPGGGEAGGGAGEGDDEKELWESLNRTD